MIRFKCPGCHKALRADDSKAGCPVKCPACAHKFKIPDAEAELPVAEEAEEQEKEEERPAPRKKKRARSRSRDTDADRGRRLVIIICCVVLGMQLVSLISYLAMTTPDLNEIAKNSARETYQKMGKDLPKDFEQNWEKLAGSKLNKDMQAMLSQAKTNALLWILGSFSVSAVLLTFLYLRFEWARLVLGVLYLIGGVFGLVGLVLGGLALLRSLSGGAAIMTALEILVRVGVTLSIGTLLMKSPSIAAYTASRKSVGTP